MSNPTKRPRILNDLEASPLRPLSTLAPKAQLLLTAAQTILMRDGFDKLSFANVAAEAGVYQSAVRYYFGSKAGLIQALVDASTHDLSAEVYAGLDFSSPLSQRLSVLVTACRTIPESEEYKSMWELLPHVLRDDTLREAVAGLYRTYRSHTEQLFDHRDNDAEQSVARVYACLLLAVLEGMAIQQALDPDEVDLERVFRLWSKIVSRSVDEILAEEAG